MRNILILAGFFLLNSLTGVAAEVPAPSSTYTAHNRVANLDKTNDFGLGLKWGSLTGIDAKYWADEERAIDFTVAFENGNTAFGVDYLWNFRTAMARNVGVDQLNNVVPYVGGGLISAFGSNTQFFNRNTDVFALAARLPLGLEFLPSRVRLGIFAEIAPSFGFVPTTYTFLTADIGARFYF